MLRASRKFQKKTRSEFKCPASNEKNLPAQFFLGGGIFLTCPRDKIYCKSVHRLGFSVMPSVATGEYSMGCRSNFSNDILHRKLALSKPVGAGPSPERYRSPRARTEWTKSKRKK